ncbi:hypothetical protein E4T56_gene7011, partial [Termitomyces sp. T112]
IDLPRLAALAIARGEADLPSRYLLTDRLALDAVLARQIAATPAGRSSPLSRESPHGRCRLFAPDGSPFHFDHSHLTYGASRDMVSALMRSRGAPTAAHHAHDLLNCTSVATSNSTTPTSASQSEQRADQTRPPRHQLRRDQQLHQRPDHQRKYAENEARIADRDQQIEIAIMADGHHRGKACAILVNRAAWTDVPEGFKPRPQHRVLRAVIPHGAPDQAAPGKGPGAEQATLHH